MADPSCGTEAAPFQAVLVFTDPVDWYRDLQLITDVIMSGQHADVANSFKTNIPSPISCCAYHCNDARDHLPEVLIIFPNMILCMYSL